MMNPHYVQEPDGHTGRRTSSRSIRQESCSEHAAVWCGAQLRSLLLRLKSPSQPLLVCIYLTHNGD
jgi:hypothetical protein